MSLSTEYCRYVGEWSEETDFVHRARVQRLEEMKVEAEKLPEGERTAYWRANAAEAEPLVNGLIAHDDPRLDYYGGHVVGIYDEHWDAFAQWAAVKGYQVYKGMPMWHSMTVWAGPDRPQPRQWVSLSKPA